MTPHIPEEFFNRLIDRSPFVIMGNTMPPRDPNEDEDEETKRTKRTKRTAATSRRSSASRTKTIRATVASCGDTYFETASSSLVA